MWQSLTRFGHDYYTFSYEISFELFATIYAFIRDDGRKLIDSKLFPDSISY